MSRYALPRNPCGHYMPHLAPEDDKRRQTKQYALDGVPGLVLRRRARQTGTLVMIYRADQAGIDAGGHPWAIVCVVHGGVVGCESLSLAKDQATEPKSWCDHCGGSK